MLLELEHQPDEGCGQLLPEEGLPGICGKPGSVQYGQEYHKKNSENLAMPYMGICSGFFHNFIEKGEDSVVDSPYYTKENIRLAERVRMLTEKYQATVTQVVLGFFTCRDFPCVPLYGPRSADHLKEAMGSFEITFMKEDYE